MHTPTHHTTHVHHTHTKLPPYALPPILPRPPYSFYISGVKLS